MRRRWSRSDEPVILALERPAGQPGTTWADASPPTAAINDGYDTSIAAVDGCTVYVSHHDDPGLFTAKDLKVVKTTDGGTTWTDVSPPATGASDGLSTSIAAVDADTVYVSHRDSTALDLKVEKSAVSGWLSLTISPKDNFRPDFTTLTARLVQIEG